MNLGVHESSGTPQTPAFNARAQPFTSPAPRLAHGAIWGRRTRPSHALTGDARHLPGPLTVWNPGASLTADQC